VRIAYYFYELYMNHKTVQLLIRDDTIITNCDTKDMCQEVAT
jgi:hypothetical protein